MRRAKPMRSTTASGRASSSSRASAASPRRRPPSRPTWRAGRRATPSTSGAQTGTCGFAQRDRRRFLSDALAGFLYWPRTDGLRGSGARPRALPVARGLFLRGSFLARLSPADYVNPEPADNEHHHVVPQSRPLRVLIADDERDTLVTLGLLCRDAGMEVRLVKWGDDVIPAVREFAPDVILLDL